MAFSPLHRQASSGFPRTVCFLRHCRGSTRRPVMRALVWLFSLILLALPSAAQDRKEVDLALAMGIDISGSIDPDEARLQREGYVQAFRDPVIIKAILGGANGRIAVSYYEWSDSWMQKLLIDWTLLDSERSEERRVGKECRAVWAPA